jgi:chemotaxis protein CheD
MISAARQVLGAGKRPSVPDELASSPAQECFARNLYFDRTHNIDAAKLLPGEYFVSTRDRLLVTVLGSCVAACIRDTRMGIGGMNHFMLPDSESEQTAANGARYGTYAMEVLINHLLKLGAQREHLEAKVFGGGNVLAGLTQANVGHKNAAFVQSFLKEENIRIAARDLADVFPRKVYFFPVSGKVLVKRLRSANNSTVAEREIEYRKRLTQAPESGEVELFS